MAIEIKVTGNDAAETVQQFLGLAGYFGAQPVAVAPVLSVTATVTADAEPDDEPEADVAAGTVDKEGLPFDERIHAKAKEPFKADGTWKRRKNISDDLYNSVRAELKERIAPAPAPVVEAVVAVEAPVAPEPVVPAPQPTAPAPVAEPVAQVAPEPAAPAPQPAVPAPAPATGKTHAELQGALTKTLQTLATALPPGDAPKVLMSLLSSYGVSGMPQVPADKVDECYDRMQRMAADPANAAAIAVGLM